MLTYLLLFNKRLEFDFFKLHPKFPRARAKQTRWKFAAFAIYHEEKPNLKSLSYGLLTQNESVTSVCFRGF